MTLFIAVSYFGSKDAKHLLRSLSRQSASWSLIIVDNSLDEREYAALCKLVVDEPNALVWRSDTNLGYFGAAAWALTKADRGDNVVVLNTDVRLGDSTTLQALEDAAAGNVGVVAPRIVSDRSGADQNPHLRSRPTSRSSLIRRLAMATPELTQLAIFLATWRARGSASRHSPPGESSKIYAGHGSFLFFTRLFFERGGDLAHPLFLFAEEIFVAEQCARLHLETHFITQATVRHMDHGQMGLVRSRTVLRASSQAARWVHREIHGSARDRGAS